jgi:hypothetical protein
MEELLDPCSARTRLRLAASRSGDTENAWNWFWKCRLSPRVHHL